MLTGVTDTWVSAFYVNPPRAQVNKRGLAKARLSLQ